MLKKIIICVSLVIILCAIGITLYGWYFSTRIEERFSARRWITWTMSLLTSSVASHLKNQP